ncbi:hypothetical protein BBJ28_00005335 [Nothophytophthora sp. Chile5]|nr:hypothetical protein BBJ28_00005335 [Nothophytophthora sp. Chile5]
MKPFVPPSFKVKGDNNNSNGHTASACNCHFHHSKRRHPWSRNNLDTWLEKAFATQDREPEAQAPRRHKRNIIQRTLTGLSFSRGAARRHHQRSEAERSACEDEHHDEWDSYSEELEKYFSEAAANLYDDEPQDDSDEDSDPEWASPRNAEIISFTASIVSDEDEHVVPPVEVPRTYRTQDRLGGVLVAGDRVLFTNSAFKRKLRRMGNLGPIPEHRHRNGEELPSLSLEEDLPSNVYAGKIVEL